MKTLFIGFIFAVIILAWRSEDLASLLSGTLASKPSGELTAASLMQAPHPE